MGLQRPLEVTIGTLDDVVDLGVGRLRQAGMAGSRGEDGEALVDEPAGISNPQR